MNEFLFLFRGGTPHHDGQMSPEDLQAHMQKWMDWMGSLAEQGKLSGAQPLHRTIGKQIKGTKKVVTDGPFMEGKEMVGGYLLCKADTLEEATAIANDCPILEFEDGIVEVRKVEILHV